jgi:hypothetical protein
MTFNKSMTQAGDYEARFGRNVAGRLADTTEHIPNDISERLKVARLQAIAKRKVVRLQEFTEVNVDGSATATRSGGGDGGLWIRIASALPLLALVAGLIAISAAVEVDRTNDMATIDTELLTDELPPDAYTDPGFTQFLRAYRKD